jgi:hypothetical protein
MIHDSVALTSTPRLAPRSLFDNLGLIPRVQQPPTTRSCSPFFSSAIRTCIQTLCIFSRCILVYVAVPAHPFKPTRDSRSSCPACIPAGGVGGRPPAAEPACASPLLPGTVHT